MKSLVILGAGTAGTMMANKLHHALNPVEWRITIVDRDNVHYYQPGFLFIPFGLYQPEDVVRPRTDFLPKGVTFIPQEVDRIDGNHDQVILSNGQTLHYEVLVVATGAEVVPEETEGMKAELWYKDIFDFYTFEGSTQLAKKLQNWQGGNLVINLAETLIKCPVAPLEFTFLADAFFEDKGIRDKVNITYVTPLSGAFTKPKATAMLSTLLDEKKIKVVPDFYLARVDNERKVLVSYDEQEVPFDLLVTVPVNKGSKMVERSGLGDEDGLNFMPTDKYTLQAKKFDNVFVIGDATNIPASKAGSVAHFEGEILLENVLSYIQGEALEARFDGHSNCFIETGHGKAALIDFNYETEPLPGKFPWPLLGPMDLLKPTRLNHVGKLAFKWVYWHMLLTGKTLPVPTHMSMSGKIKEETV
ncbi:MAG: NAD(P)/FAD-dependent oxidoreductase [Cyclobacteriaceae bacterium]|jgi:sulfide:quinone oxidoreductase|nr:NAD(P)/FAD-dependent oxidoreductase [Flammeovirgaceae bacterium]